MSIDLSMSVAELAERFGGSELWFTCANIGKGVAEITVCMSEFEDCFENCTRVFDQASVQFRSTFEFIEFLDQTI